MKSIVPLTPAQKAAIERLLYSGASALFVPQSLLEPSNDQPSGFPEGSHSLVPPTFAEVSGETTSIDDFYSDLQAADPITTIYELSSLNVLLDRLGTDSAFQRAAVDRYVRPEFRDPPSTDLSEPRPNYEFIINRIGAMIAFKGVVGIERTTQPPPSPFRTGDLILRANQFVSGTRFDGTIVPQTEADLAAETICTWDLTNPRDIAYETARMYRMLELLDSPDEKVRTLKNNLGIVTADLRFAGLPIIDFLAIVFGIVALAGSIPPAVVLGSPRAAAIDGRTLLANVKIPQTALDTFLANRSISLADLKSRLTSGGSWTPEEYARQMAGSKFRTDFLPFREFPLLAMSATEYVIPHLQFLTELMFSGVFFELYLSFPRGQRDALSSLWGRLFELSIFELLEYCYPPLSGILRTNVEYDGGEVDALLDFGEYIVVFEFKHFLLTQDVKYSRSGALLEGALKERLFANRAGKPKAIRQLIESASAIRSGKIQTLLGRANALPRQATIYPVVVVADPALEAPFVNVFCNRLFQGAVGDVEVEPLTVMSVHEFENTVPLISDGQLTWRELLEFRFDRREVRPTSVNQAHYMLSREKRLTYVRNFFRLEEYRQIFEQMRSRYTGESPQEPRNADGV